MWTKWWCSSEVRRDQSAGERASSYDWNRLYRTSKQIWQQESLPSSPAAIEEWKTMDVRPQLKKWRYVFECVDQNPQLCCLMRTCSKPITDASREDHIANIPCCKRLKCFKGCNDFSSLAERAYFKCSSAEPSSRAALNGWFLRRRS